MAKNVDDSLPDPPAPPEIRRRVSLYSFQWIGLPFLLAIPVLALFGVFGERRNAAHAADGALEVSIEYPAVLRYRMLGAIDLRVRNRSASAIDTVTVALDTAYAARFSNLNAAPPITTAFQIELLDVPPDGTRRVRIELQADRYWSHSGHLTVTTSTDTAGVLLTTMVYP